MDTRPPDLCPIPCNTLVVAAIRGIGGKSSPDAREIVGKARVGETACPPGVQARITGQHKPHAVLQFRRETVVATQADTRNEVVEGVVDDLVTAHRGTATFGDQTLLQPPHLIQRHVREPHILLTSIAEQRVVVAL